MAKSIQATGRENSYSIAQSVSNLRQKIRNPIFYFDLDIFCFSSDDEKQVTINDVRRGGSLRFLISARSIHTLVYE